MLQTVKHNTDEIRARCRAIIDRFAHRDAIREEDIREWLGYVVREHGEEALWHATRAGGFGGSDIGVLVRNFQGYRADHQASAHDIIASKLLRAVPTEETGDLRRGHANEARHAEMYYAKYGAERDQAAFSALSKATGLRPWMRYSPDDVVLKPSPQPNPGLGGSRLRRVLTDYKAPRVVDGDDSIAFQYSCQLHQGAMICARSGIHLDALELSQFDWAQWALKDDYIAYSPDLARLIVGAGDHYAGYVMRGELPPYIYTPKFDDEDAYLQRFGMKAQVLAHISAMAKAFVDEAEARAAELKEALKGSRLAGTRLKMGDLTASAVTLVAHAEVAKLVTRDEAAALRKKGGEPAYDVAAMAQKLAELGGDPRQFRTDRFDADRAYDFLVAAGHDPEAFMQEQIRFTVSGDLKQQAKDVVSLTYPRSEAAAPIDIEEAAEAEPDVREGQSTERLAPRTAMA